MQRCFQKTLNNYETILMTSFYSCQSLQASTSYLCFVCKVCCNVCLKLVRDSFGKRVCRCGCLGKSNVTCFWGGEFSGSHWCSKAAIYFLTLSCCTH